MKQSRIILTRKSRDYRDVTLKSKAGVLKFRKARRPNRRNEAAVFICLRCSVNEQKSKMTDTKKNVTIHPPEYGESIFTQIIIIVTSFENKPIRK